MSLFAWHDEYSIQHPQIDQQHKTLFRAADELHSAMKRGAGREVIAGTLGTLIRYTQSHFREEETLMRAGNYPEYAAHKAEHDDLIRQVLELQKSLAAGNTTVTIEVMSFLLNWLQNHIGIRDQKIAAHFRSASGAGSRPCQSRRAMAIND